MRRARTFPARFDLKTLFESPERTDHGDDMRYTEIARDHFLHPRNVGEIPDADGLGMVGDPECGDALEVWIKVEDERLVDVKFKLFGCPAALAACSIMTELAIGKSVDEAYELTDQQVADALGGLPEDKLHCSNLAASALHEAITNYVFKSIRKAGVTVLEAGD